MKYHGFESPPNWSQYLIQKADKHEYEPVSYTHLTLPTSDLV